MNNIILLSYTHSDPILVLSPKKEQEICGTRERGMEIVLLHMEELEIWSEEKSESIIYHKNKPNDFNLFTQVHINKEFVKIRFSKHEDPKKFSLTRIEEFQRNKTIVIRWRPIGNINNEPSVPTLFPPSARSS